MRHKNKAFEVVYLKKKQEVCSIDNLLLNERGDGGMPQCQEKSF